MPIPLDLAGERRGARDPELRLLYLTARETLSAPARDEVRACVMQCADPDRFVRLCGTQRTALLAFNSLGELMGSADSGFYKTTMNGLFSHYANWRRRRMRLVAMTHVVRETLEDARLTFAFLRGIPFAERFYRFPMLRTSADIDIFVQEHERDGVMEAMASRGFRPLNHEVLHRTRVEYVGQAELFHKNGTVADVNWLLPGTISIGKVVEDQDVIWKRACRVGETERELAPEDAFLTHVRHAAHAHGFDGGLLRTCADIAAILRTSGEGMDWDYVSRRAAAGEYGRVLTFLSSFFDRHYDCNEPAWNLCGRIPNARRRASRAECAAFSRSVLIPYTRTVHVSGKSLGLVDGNLRAAVTYWGLDRFSRLVRLVLRIPWPTWHQLVTLTQTVKTRSSIKRRLGFLVNPLAFVMPGILLGVGARLLFAPFPRGRDGS